MPNKQRENIINVCNGIEIKHKPKFLKQFVFAIFHAQISIAFFEDPCQYCTRHYFLVFHSSQ